MVLAAELHLRDVGNFLTAARLVAFQSVSLSCTVVRNCQQEQKEAYAVADDFATMRWQLRLSMLAEMLTSMRGLFCARPG